MVWVRTCSRTLCPTNFSYLPTALGSPALLRFSPRSFTCQKSDLNIWLSGFLWNVKILTLLTSLILILFGFSLHKKTLSNYRMKLLWTKYMRHAEIEPRVSIFVKLRDLRNEIMVKFGFNCSNGVKFSNFMCLSSKSFILDSAFN